MLLTMRNPGTPYNPLPDWLRDPIALSDWLLYDGPGGGSPPGVPVEGAGMNHRRPMSAGLRETTGGASWAPAGAEDATGQPRVGWAASAEGVDATTPIPPKKRGRPFSSRLEDLMRSDYWPPYSAGSGDVRSQYELRGWLRAHQRRLRAGEPLPTLAEIARFVGISRMWLYRFMRGERPSVALQRRLSSLVNRLDMALDLKHCREEPRRLRFRVRPSLQGGLSVQWY